MNNNISDKDKKDWKNFLEKNEKLPNKDLEIKDNKFHITKSLDLHGFTLDEANKKVESFIIDCFDQKVSKVIIVTGKGLHSQNDKDPYVSKEFGILKNSVPDFIKNNSNLMKKIKSITDAEITFIGVNSANIKEHKFLGKILQVTVEFVGEVITCIRDKDKKIVSGDPEKIKKIYDTWVFSRDTSTNNPNWQLVDTLS